MKKAFITLLLGLSLQAGSVLAKPGDSQEFAELESTPNAMTALGGNLYVSTGKFIFQIDKNGKVDTVPFPQHWDSIRELATLGGKLYCFSITTLFEVEVGQPAKPLSEEFKYVAAMTSMDNNLYLVSANTFKLYALGKDGKETALSQGWSFVRDMASMNGKLYILTKEQLHAVDAKGKGKVIDGPALDNPTALAAGEGKLYVAATERNQKVLYEIEPSGKRKRLARPAGANPEMDVTAMTVLDGNLYMSVPTVGASSKIFSLSIR